MTTGQPVFDKLPEDAMIRLNQACNRFEQRWLAGDPPDRVHAGRLGHGFCQRSRARTITDRD